MHKTKKTTYFHEEQISLLTTGQTLPQRQKSPPKSKVASQIPQYQPCQMITRKIHLERKQIMKVRIVRLISYKLIQMIKTCVQYALRIQNYVNNTQLRYMIHLSIIRFLHRNTLRSILLSQCSCPYFSLLTLSHTCISTIPSHNLEVNLQQILGIL